MTRLSKLLTVVSVISLTSHSLEAKTAFNCSELFESRPVVSTGWRQNAVENGVGRFSDNAMNEALGGAPFRISSDAKSIEKLRLKKLPKNLSPELMSIVRELLSPTYLVDGTVVINTRPSRWMDLGRKHSEDHEPLFALFVQNHFELLYQNMVNWVYQKEHLEPNSALTTAKLADESDDYARQHKPLSYFLAFSSETWASQLRYLESQWQSNSGKSNVPRSERIGELTGQVPYWPLAGVAFARTEGPTTDPVEFKRYFKNVVEDPLGILSIKSSPNEFNLRQQLLLTALKTLPADTTVEIHSHTRIHTIAYRKLGFHVDSKIVNPKFPEASIDLLRATNDEVIDKITALLQKRAEAR